MGLVFVVCVPPRTLPQPLQRAQKILSSITVGTNLGHRRVAEAQHSHLTFTDKHFSSYCKVSSAVAAAATSRAPVTRNGAPLFSRISSKVFGEVLLPSFFIYRSIFQSISGSLVFFSRQI